MRKHDVQMLRVRLDEIIEIYEVIGNEPVSELPSSEVFAKWKRLSTEFDEGINKLSSAVSSLQIMVQLGQIK